MWCFILYLDCRSWRGCCCQARRRSAPGCLATPGRRPGSRGATVPLRRGKKPPSCWWARRLPWGRGTVTGWDGAAPPPCFSMSLESRCSSWGYTSLPGIERWEGETSGTGWRVLHLYLVQSRFRAGKGKLQPTCPLQSKRINQPTELEEIIVNDLKTVFVPFLQGSKSHFNK